MILSHIWASDFLTKDEIKPESKVREQTHQIGYYITSDIWYRDVHWHRRTHIHAYTHTHASMDMISLRWERERERNTYNSVTLGPIQVTPFQLSEQGSAWGEDVHPSKDDEGSPTLVKNTLSAYTEQRRDFASCVKPYMWVQKNLHCQSLQADGDPVVLHYVSSTWIGDESILYVRSHISLVRASALRYIDRKWVNYIWRLTHFCHEGLEAWSFPWGSTRVLGFGSIQHSGLSESDRFVIHVHWLGRG
jgi:hypothetical protein